MANLPTKRLSSSALSIAIKGMAAAFAISCCIGESAAEQVLITSATSTAPQGGSGGSSGLGNLFDGNFLGTSYQAFTGGGAVTFDFGTAQVIDRMVIVGKVGGVRNITAGTIETSLDGITWTAAAPFSNPNTGGGTTLALGFEAVQARYVRLSMTSSNVAQEVMSEVSFYNGSGPNLSLVGYGGTIRTDLNYIPYSVVDKNPGTFALWSGTSGSFTLRLDAPEYADGWSGLTLSGNSHAVYPANPGILKIFAGDSLDSLTLIYEQSNEKASAATFSYLLEFGETYHYDYIKVAWEQNSDWVGTAQSNVQISGVDVIAAIPEPGSVALISLSFVATLGASAYRRFRIAR